ncbi:ATP synthase F1 subunit gamma [Candidatus Wolfebacteria bacterium]|nr:ATP synthase F1 subunit gamma [Candidatus Wolfebacteria bacterium]
MSLKSIKSKIKATERIHKVTKAMEAVSAVKMRKSQKTALSGRSYATAAVSILSRFAGGAFVKNHPMFVTRTGKKFLMLVITSDKGLAGSLNAGVLKAAETSIKLKSPDTSLVHIYAIGKKGRDYFRNRGPEIVGYTENKDDGVEMELIQDVVDVLTTRFVSGEYHECVVVCSRFNSTFEQIPTVRTLLPLSSESLSKIVSDIAPKEGKWSGEEKSKIPVYTVEPSPEEVLEVLIPKLLAIGIYHLLLEGKASEHSARMVAMKGASDKSSEVKQELKLTFNRARQSVITREVSEIIGGIEAMAN